MAISVIALIRIPPDRTEDDSEKLARHKKMETGLVTAKDRGFSYFERVEERNCFYIFGQFESLDEVYVDPESIENISDIIQLGGLAHFHCRIDSVTADADVLVLHRFNMKADSWPNFARQLEDRPGETTGDAGRLVCGWRMDPKRDEQDQAPNMFDHVALSVPQDKYPAVVDFYIAALAPLGYEKLVSMFDDKLVALGDKNSPMANKADFWLSGMAESVVDKNYAHWAFTADGQHPQTGASLKSVCLANRYVVFLERSKVDASYEKALAAGGKDNGAPGPRPHFGPQYYAAFVIDPMGNNIEVVCRK
ncbi:hypothetical protein NHJ13734_002845 [Beauveria thailandica]